MYWQIFQEGRNAFKSGKHLTDNPYQEDTTEWENWDTGWFAGRDDKEEDFLEQPLSS